MCPDQSPYQGKIGLADLAVSVTSEGFLRKDGLSSTGFQEEFKRGRNCTIASARTNRFAAKKIHRTFLREISVLWFLKRIPSRRTKLMLMANSSGEPPELGWLRLM